MMVLDGNPAMHTVTVRFAQYPGLEYHFSIINIKTTTGMFFTACWTVAWNKLCLSKGDRS